MVPTLYEWCGGEEAIVRLMETFYARVPKDEMLAPIFANMDPDHAKHVAAFIAEVLGGPATYSEKHGGHPHMVRKHLLKHLTEIQRKRWMNLLLECADEVGLPSDPEFRSAFVGYIEWGSRLAIINSQDGAAADDSAQMPKWTWGAPGGPYQPES